MTTPNSTVSDEAQRIIATYGRATPVDDLSLVLFEAWCKADPGSGPAQFPASYLATFADMARAAIAWNTRSLSTGTDAGVRVRKLEWVKWEYDNAPSAYGTIWLGGSYHVRLWGGAWRWKDGAFDRSQESGGGRGSFPTADEAKAAAQADYEQRIRSTLEQQPAASQEPPTGKERLHVAQNATTPVAWLGTNLDGESEPFLTKRQAEFWSSGACHVEPLYTRPAPTQDKASPGMAVAGLLHGICDSLRAAIMDYEDADTFPGARKIMQGQLDALKRYLSALTAALTGKGA